MDLLAQSDTSSAIVPTLIVLLFIVALIGAIAVVRKRMFAGQSDENDPMAGFSLSSMRQMVRDGKMTPAEYEAAKQQIVAAAHRASQRQDTAKDTLEHKLPPDPNELNHEWDEEEGDNENDDDGGGEPVR